MNNVLDSVRSGFQDMCHAVCDTAKKIPVGAQKIHNRVHSCFQEVKASSCEMCTKGCEKAASFWKKHERILGPLLLSAVFLGIPALVTAVAIPIILFAPTVFAGAAACTLVTTLVINAGILFNLTR